jgi:hypothetical protein
MMFDFVVAPLLSFLAGAVIGTIFNFAPIKSLKNKAIIVTSLVLVSAVGFYFLANLFSGNIASIYFFQAFASILEGPITEDLQISAPFAASILLIIVFEGSLTLSFAVEGSVGSYLKKRKQKNQTLLQTPIIKSSPQTIQQVNYPSDKSLLKDEQYIMDFFNDEKVTEITPVVNSTNPEGYSFERPLQDWDTKWARLVLDSLVQKDQLKAELIDKVITCTACGSANVRIRKLCPECNSMLLRKDSLVEHFSCGAVAKREAFDTTEGILVCPFCKQQLIQANSDYRILPPSYVCLNCNYRTNTPLIMAKCENCETTAELDEEPEIELHKYTAKTK